MGTSIRRLVEQIQHSELVMPAFQREYVWNLEQAKVLMTSLFLQYPTGSLLFWETGNPPELKNKGIPFRSGTRTTVILDGQQRLTTLYLLLRDSVPPYYQADDIEHDPRHLFFNLDTAEFKYYTAQEMSGNPLWFRLADIFKKPPDPLEVALLRTGEDRLSEAVLLQKKLNANLNRLNGLLDQEYPVQMVPDTANVNDAIRIFDLVNRQGTKLSEAELALAHMSGNWPDARRVLKEKIKGLSLRGFEFDLTFMVRCMTAVVTGRAEYELIHNRPKKELLEGWNLLERVLDNLVSTLRAHAFVHSTYDLNTTNVLVPIVAYLARQNGQFPNASERNRFLYWMYAALLWARYSGQTDQRLTKDVGIVLKSANPTRELINELLDQRGRIEVRPGDLEGRDIRHPIYRMMFTVAKSKGAVDWFTGTALSEPGVGEKGANCYVFPYDFLYSHFDSSNHLHRQKVNEIANRLLLSRWPVIELNRAEPLGYLENVEARYPGSLDAYCIPRDRTLWSIERYDDFLRTRRVLIAETINGFMSQLTTDGQPEREDLSVTIANGETEQVEFKETLRLDLYTGKTDPKLREKTAREIAALMNAQGGMLIVGVSDDKTITGIDRDVATFDDPSEDKLQLYIQEAVKGRLGMEHLAYTHISFATVESMRVCVIDVEPSPSPVYFQESSAQRDLYVRLGTSAQKLDAKAALDYTRQRWGSN